ncbi:SLC13 family permease, partial [Streptomyces virens]|uniref:SLC13 family permease n=1 Tax=Streptomyces virens TaxID=285572 RepID=UPI0031F88626
MEAVDDQRLVEIVISPEASVLGKTLETLNFRQRYDATVLAIRRGGRIIHARMDERGLRAGDTLLIQATEETVQRFANDRDFIVAQELTLPDFRYRKMAIAIGIVLAVVGLAALDVLPILISALGGIVAMVATGCVKPEEVYPLVDWSVIFLLAGLIPLGVAMERTGAGG